MRRTSVSMLRQGTNHFFVCVARTHEPGIGPETSMSMCNQNPAATHTPVMAQMPAPLQWVRTFLDRAGRAIPHVGGAARSRRSRRNARTLRGGVLLLALGLSGYALPAAAQFKGCTQVYATQRNLTGAQSIYTFTAPNTLGSPGTATPALIGAAAIDPATGYLYYYGVTDPANTSATLVHTNTLYRYDPVTRVSTLIGTTDVAGVLEGIAAGATFDNAGNLYVLFSGQGNDTQERATARLARVNITTGAVESAVALSGQVPDTGGSNPGARPRDIGVIGDLVVDAGGTMYYYGKGGGDLPAFAQINPATGNLSGRVTIDFFDPDKLPGRTGGLSDYLDGATIDSETGYRYATTTEEGLGGIYQITANTNAGITGQLAVEGLTDMAGCALPVDRPTVQKAFSPSSITVGGISTLTITLANTNAGPITLDTALMDTFPAGVVRAATPNLGGTCFAIAGNSSLIGSASGSVTASAGLMIPGTTYNGTGGCTLTIDVTSNATGTYTNTIAAGAYSTSVGTNVAAGSAQLLVLTPRTLTLTKAWVDGVAGDAVSLTASSDGAVTGTPVAGSAVVGSAPSPASVVTLPGSTVTLTEAFTTGNPANYGKTLSCTSGTLTYTADALTGSLVMPDADVTCTYTNTSIVTDLTITKSNPDGDLLAGSTTTYTIVVANPTGPAAANNAVVRDPVATGLSCTTAPNCSASGGASCPASPSVAALQGTGLVIPLLPVGGAVTFTLTCTVTASGQ